MIYYIWYFAKKVVTLQYKNGRNCPALVLFVIDILRNHRFFKIYKSFQSPRHHG